MRQMSVVSSGQSRCQSVSNCHHLVVRQPVTKCNRFKPKVPISRRHFDRDWRMGRIPVSSPACFSRIKTKWASQQGSRWRSQQNKTGLLFCSCLSFVFNLKVANVTIKKSPRHVLARALLSLVTSLLSIYINTIPEVEEEIPLKAWISLRS